MTEGESEYGRPTVCWQCGGSGGYHDDGCSVQVPRPIKLAIAMPLEGPPEVARCHYSVQQCLRRLAGVKHMDFSFGPEICANVDVSKCRDRIARIFLTESELADCTHLLWWDEDVLPDDLGIIQRMLAVRADFVAAPYPRKQGSGETFAFRIDGTDGERRQIELDRECIAVDGVSFGFTITSRTCLHAMWDYYRADRWYLDTFAGTISEQVGLFDLCYSPSIAGPNGRPFRVKLSEDYSFCQSWRAIGGKCLMFLGQGSPVAHLGSKAYRGSRDSIIWTPPGEGMANAPEHCSAFDLENKGA